MKMLIVYPHYTPSREDIAYRKSVAIRSVLDRQVAKDVHQVLPFQSTSSYLDAPTTGAIGSTGFAGAPRRTGSIDWGDDDDEIIPIIPGDDDLPIGAATPVGDAIYPLMLLLLGYLFYRRLSQKLRW